MKHNNTSSEHRRSLRLKDYDYSQAGLYYITICIQNKLNLFGDVVDDKVILNNAGKIVEKWWFELKNKFHNYKLYEHIVMPNHFHGIIEIGEMGRHAGQPLQDAVQWFKTMTTNEYIRGVKDDNWQPFDQKLWQRNYYEHIIRDEKSHSRISEYIETNPIGWSS
jgi:putative transposase